MGFFKKATNVAAKGGLLASTFFVGHGKGRIDERPRGQTQTHVSFDINDKGDKHDLKLDFSPTAEEYTASALGAASFAAALATREKKKPAGAAK